MIDISTLNAIHKQTTEALQNYRIAEALRGLEVLTQECQDRQLALEAEAARLDYARMLDFLAEGGRDEKHSDIHDKMVKRLLHTLDATTRQIRLQKGEDLYSKAFARLTNTYGQESSQILRLQWNEQQGMTERYETQDLLFDLLWTSPRWDSHQTAEWFEFMSRLDHFTKQHLTGAIILSLWEYFDEEKLTLLRLLSEAEEIPVRMQAITGYVLMSLRYETRLALSPSLQLDTNDKTLSRIVHLVQRELLLMKESPKVNKAISQELSRLNFQQMESADFHQELEKVMQRYGQLLALGIDLDLNKISLLHSSRFLRSISHWWAPFDESRPMVEEVFVRKDGELAEGLRKMFSRSAECSVSRYAVCEAMQQHVNLAMLDQQLMQFMQQKQEEEEEADEDDNQLETKRMEKALQERLAVRGFIQNLYRFFYHSPLAGEIANAFELNLLLSDNSLLHPFFPSKQLLHTARLLVQFQQNEAALHVLKEITDRDGFSAETLRLMGQCNQNKGNLAQAAQCFSQADLLEEDDLWTLSQLELCYARLQRYDRLWDILQRLDRLKPDNISIARRQAGCLLMQGKHAEALQYLYKVELNDTEDLTTLTQIALSAAHLQRFDTSEKYIQKRLEREEPLTKAERLMIGSVYFAEGRWNKALSYFRQVDMAAFEATAPQFLSLGIPLHDIRLMHDIIERER